MDQKNIARRRASFSIPATALCVLLLLMIMPGSSTAFKTDEDKALQSKWAGAVCRDLGCMSIAYMKYGVNLTAQGLVQDRSVLEGYGFSFGEGPYRVSATRIDTGRYQIRVQSMSRREDHQVKAIRLKTEADTLYPVPRPPAPEGDYMWNAAIQFDMEDQLGIAPHFEMEEEPRTFVDILVADPEKFAAAGFPGYSKNDGSLQLHFQGDDRWKISPDGGILVYQNATWVVETTAASSGSGVSGASAEAEEGADASGKDADQGGIETEKHLEFVSVNAFDTAYNQKPFDWNVFESQTGDRTYYLVRHPDIGSALLDVTGDAMWDAEAAQPLPGGSGMAVDTEDLTRLEPSGVEQVELGPKKIVVGWWDKETLMFTLGGVSPGQTMMEPENVKDGAPEPPLGQSVMAAGVQTDGPEASSEETEKPVSASTTQSPASGETAGDNSATDVEMSSIYPLLFANSDFEMGDLTHWTAEGNAFSHQPTKGDNPTARNRITQPSHHQGDFWIGTFEKYRGGPGERPGMRQGDRPTGTLTSVPFEIKEETISFLIGGGRHPKKETVSLLVEGRPVLSATGKNHETLKPVVWDVSPYLGRTARIVITDQHNGGWGHINADAFGYGIQDFQ